MKRSTAEGPTPERIAFGYNFKIARLKLGKSLRDVGRECRASPAYLSQVERGLVGVSLDKAAELAAAVGMPLFALMSSFPTEKQIADLHANADPTIIDRRLLNRPTYEQAIARGQLSPENRSGPAQPAKPARARKAARVKISK